MNALRKFVHNLTGKPWAFTPAEPNPSPILIDTTFKNSGVDPQTLKLSKEANVNYIADINRYLSRTTYLSAASMASFGVFVILLLNMPISEINPAWYPVYLSKMTIALVGSGWFFTLVKKRNATGFPFTAQELTGKLEAFKSTESFADFIRGCREIEPSLYLLRDDSGFYELESFRWSDDKIFLYLFGNSDLRKAISKDYISEHSRLHIMQYVSDQLIKLLQPGAEQDVETQESNKQNPSPKNEAESIPDISRLSPYYRALVMSDDLINLYMEKRSQWFEYEIGREFKYKLDKHKAPYDKLICYIASNRKVFREGFRNKKISEPQRQTLLKEIKDALEIELKSDSMLPENILNGVYGPCSKWLCKLDFIDESNLPKTD